MGCGRLPKLLCRVMESLPHSNSLLVQPQTMGQSRTFVSCCKILQLRNLDSPPSPISEQDLPVPGKDYRDLSSFTGKSAPTERLPASDRLGSGTVPWTDWAGRLCFVGTGVF